jgi:hypothetical protein
MYGVICSVVFFAIMLLFIQLNYIDFSVFRAIYLPVYFIGW